MGTAVNFVSCSNLNFMAAYHLIFGVLTSIVTLRLPSKALTVNREMVCLESSCTRREMPFLNQFDAVLKMEA